MSQVALYSRKHSFKIFFKMKVTELSHFEQAEKVSNT